MAKRSRAKPATKPAKKRPTRINSAVEPEPFEFSIERLVPIDDDGIYPRFRRETVEVTEAQWAADVVARLKGTPLKPFAQVLDEIEQQAAVAQRRDSPTSQAVTIARALVVHLRQLRNGTLPPDAALVVAVRIGQLAERLQVLPYEEDVKQNRRRKKPHQVKVDAQKKDAKDLHDAIVKMVQERQAANPGEQITTTYIKVATELTKSGQRVAWRTVKKVWNKKNREQG